MTPRPFNGYLLFYSFIHLIYLLGLRLDFVIRSIYFIFGLRRDILLMFVYFFSALLFMFANRFDVQIFFKVVQMICNDFDNIECFIT